MATLDTDKIFGPLAFRILGWVGAAVGGALLMLLLNSTGDRAAAAAETKRIDNLAIAVRELQTTYATNKRVDDLQYEVRSNYASLSVKMDNMLKVLLERGR